MLSFSKIPSWLKNKFLLAGIFFLVWMIFFDDKDIASSVEKKQKLGELQKSETHFTQQIVENQQELDLLRTNAQTIETYAREKYMMKKDNEDLFIVKPQP
jgi:cell division protein DivIC